MNKHLKKFLQFGAGAFYMTRDSLTKVGKKLKDEGVFDEKKSKKVVHEAVKSTHEGVQKAAESIKNATTKSDLQGEDETEITEDPSVDLKKSESKKSK